MPRFTTAMLRALGWTSCRSTPSALELVHRTWNGVAHMPSRRRSEVRALSREAGVEIGHIMIPGMIDEDDDAPSR
jgi:hypothetical protein